MECTIHVFPSLHLKRNTIWADQWTCLQLSNFIELYSKWLQVEPILSQHWPYNWMALSSPHVFETVQPNLSRTQQTPSSASTNWMHTPLCNLNYLHTRRLNVHREHNTSPLPNSYLYVKSQSASRKLNSFKLAASQNGYAFTAAYVPYPRDQANHSSLKWAS